MISTQSINVLLREKVKKGEEWLRGGDCLFRALGGRGGVDTLSNIKNLVYESGEELSE